MQCAGNRLRWFEFVVAFVLACAGVAQAQRGVAGDVRDTEGQPVAAVTVTLTAADGSTQTAKADAAGRFSFTAAVVPPYTLRASDARGLQAISRVDAPQERVPVHLVLRKNERVMEFSDAPSFTVAGVTDWTAVGGHGSDATLRTSEELTRETSGLQTSRSAVTPALNAPMEAKLRAAWTAAPREYATNHALGEFYLQAGRAAQALPLLQTAAALRTGAQDEFLLAEACAGMGDVAQARQHVSVALARQDSAASHRLAGELDERLGDALASVREFERATALEPDEANFFAWGSELLLHRAIWQAVEVFGKGAARYPRSTRLLTGWGAALFAGARYDKASERLCAASDVDPASRETYVLLGKAALAAPQPLPCASSRLERFLRLQPRDADANYYQAMLLLREGGAAATARATELLRAAVVLDPKQAEALLQLGVLAMAEHQPAEAITRFRQAIAADAQLAEAHYRLGVALDRSGQHDEATQELQVHAELVKAQADAVEAQRRQVKQFLVTLQPTP